MKKKFIALISVDAVQDKIHFIRGRKVMLDNDLASLYQIKTFNLNKAVQRNIQRFPGDFMFQLTRSEYHALRFQFGILEKGRHSKYLPYVFTQEGVSMLSGILHSERAVEVNVAIMRAFVRMQQEELENKLIAHDYQIEDIIKAIRKLMREPRKQKPKIGYLL